MHILKHKEIELCRIMSRKGKKTNNNSQNSQQSNGGAAAAQQEENKNPKDLKNKPIVIGGQYPNAQINKMMMDAAGTGRVYHLEPSKHIELIQ